MTVQSVAAAIARRICDSENVGYSQPERRSWYANADWAGHVSSPQNADCSSLVCGAICYGLHDTYGVPWGHQALLEINDHWTGNMRGGMELRGFSEVPWNDSDLTPAGGFRVGDVILSAANEGGVGHVVIAVEDGGDPLVSEAWIAEDGSIDGYAGDTTGQETRTVRYSTHPHTRAGRWTSCHRFSDQKFLSQWPSFAPKQGGQIKPAAPAAARPAPSPSAPQHAHGIDISSHQAGLNVGAIWADFVIVKATEDDDYVNPYMVSQAQATLGASKRLGFYHFARPGDAAAQARYFVSAVGALRAKATLWLDWEANAVSQGPGWAKTFLDTVKSLTGATPGIYMNGSAVNGYDWSAVASQYPALVRRRTELLGLRVLLQRPLRAERLLLGSAAHPPVHRGRTTAGLLGHPRPEPLPRPRRPGPDDRGRCACRYLRLGAVWRGSAHRGRGVRGSHYRPSQGRHGRRRVRGGLRRRQPAPLPEQGRPAGDDPSADRHGPPARGSRLGRSHGEGLPVPRARLEQAGSPGRLGLRGLGRRRLRRSYGQGAPDGAERLQDQQLPAVVRS